MSGLCLPQVPGGIRELLRGGENNGGTVPAAWSLSTLPAWDYQEPGFHGLQRGAGDASGRLGSLP